ncbi:MAG: RpiB/LacA/LacB family sugar-phosphate isomerase [bacterium]|nr:RpiB/LacA/LacB family sugar-phosphate isomerase [bacterium]
MLIYIGSDHRGFKLKESLKIYLKESGYEIADVGNSVFDQADDYPDFGKAVAKEISLDPENSRGILICGSGVGMDVVANRFKNVRSVLASTPDQAASSRNDDNTNVLSIAADFLTESEVKKILTIWLQTDFSEEERHRRRLEKIDIL